MLGSFTGEIIMNIRLIAAMTAVALGSTVGHAQLVLYASDIDGDRILKYDQVSGAYVGVFASGSGLDTPDGLCFTPGGNLLVTSKANSRVLEFNGTTGAFVRIACSPPSPEDAQLGPDGLVYSSTFNQNTIRRYDPTTGTLVGIFGNASPMTNPVNMQFGPDGNLYICGFASGNINRLDGISGASLGTFIPGGSNEIAGLEGLVFGPDGFLYVASRNNGRILRFDSRTGAPSDWLAQLPENGTQGITFLCNGNLAASTYTTSAANIHEIDRTTGAIVRSFPNPGGRRSSGLVAWPGQPSVVRPPIDTSVCPGGNTQFSVFAAGSGPFEFQWRKDGLNINPLTNTSALTDSLVLPSVSTSSEGLYDCVVTNACGSVTSHSARLLVCPADCTCDGGVNIDDLLFFLAAFEAGTLEADLDNGTSSGTPDGGVTIDDLLFFLIRFEAGC